LHRASRDFINPRAQYRRTAVLPWANHLNTRRFRTSIFGPIFRPEAPYRPVAKTPII
jgi:hypothetical protein